MAFLFMKMIKLFYFSALTFAMMFPADPNYFQTIEQKATASFDDRGSKFIAVAAAVNSIEAFKQFLAETKKEHPKASHHCFAYRIGGDGMIFRASDAGEPSGSAGRPILGQIDSRGLTNTAVIVVRYFGGTLLGVPGLINAYKSAAGMALQLTPIIRKQVEIPYELQFDYTVTNEVLKGIRKFNCTILHQELQLFSLYKIGIPRTHEQETLRMLGEINGLVIQKSA
jgi:uncharacterized YigZ family protein